MAKYTTENIHTVALAGHGGAGKTTLAEALLWKTGMIGAMGSTERGSTVADSDPLEKTDGGAQGVALGLFEGVGVRDGAAAFGAAHGADHSGFPQQGLGQSRLSRPAVAR